MNTQNTSVPEEITFVVAPGSDRSGSLDLRGLATYLSEQTGCFCQPSSMQRLH